MDREKFLYELQARLQGRIPDQQLQAVMEYYNAYFDDAGPEREQEVLDGLGAPAQVARQILGERALKEMEQKENRGVFKTLGIVIMAIFAAPIALPVALGLAIVAFVLVLLIVVAVLMVGVAGVCGVATGVVVAVAGFRMLLTSWATTVYFLGGGLFMIGMGILLVMVTLTLSKLCIRGFTRLAGRILRRKEVGA